MRKPSQLVRVAAAAAALLVSVAVFKRYMPYAPSNLALKQPPAVVLTMEDAYLVGLGSKGKLWSLRADKVEMSQNRATTTLTRIRGGKVFANGKPVLKIDAGSASYDVYYRNLMLSGGVDIKSNSGERIFGEGASWNAAGCILQSLGPVTFETSWSTIKAESLLLNTRIREMTLRNVRLRVDLRKARGLIDAEGGAGAD